MKRLIITGGTGGLGRAVIRAFDSPEWEIFAPTREDLDLLNLSSVNSSLGSNPIDLLVYSAGSILDTSLMRMDGSIWDQVFSINFRGAAACAEAVLPGMIQQGRGHIVFISSYSALHPPVGQVAYATAKAALLGLTASLARENGRCGIRVNAILPGFMETRMSAKVSTHRKAEILGDHVLGRFNTPETVAKFIRFLHEELPETSGQFFQLDNRPV